MFSDQVKGTVVRSTTQMTYLKFSCNLLCLLALSLVIGCTTAVDQPVQVEVGTVSLLIDFLEEDTQPSDIDVEIGCSANATVFEVLQRAQTEGLLKFEHTSNLVQESASVYVTAIGGVDSSSGNSWTYYVNDELAKEGCGTCAVKPGDKIRWVFGEPPEILQ